MKHRITAIVLVLALCLSCAAGVHAASAEEMTDISGHWAEQYISWVLDQGLYQGTTETTFSPDGNMTRAMFITVLGRFEGLDPDAYADWYIPYLYGDIRSNAYYAPYVNWATRYGITTGVTDFSFAPNQNITREQMAVFLVRYAERFQYGFKTITDSPVEEFTDAASVGKFAREAVELMRVTGLMNGRHNGDGTYRFDPKAKATRAECAAVFQRLSEALTFDPDAYIEEPTSVELYPDEARVCPGDVCMLDVYVDGWYAQPESVIWFSTNPKVMTVDSEGIITVHSKGTAEIYALTCNGLYDFCTLVSDDYVGYEGESYSSKCFHLFGEYVDNPRKPYGPDAPKETYLANMVTVKVKVWDFKNGIGSEKVTKTRSFQVHKNLALTAQKIFEEIYACEEQYPIESIVTYWSESGNSEHCPGLAIDINPDSNPYVKNGQVLVGKAFDPENDPYSMPIDGEVQQIFEKYGFIRGIWWSSSIDYMHYSFFGT